MTGDALEEILRLAGRLTPSIGPVHVHDRVASTQDEAARLAADGAVEGTVVAARAQSSGRGRRGRDWFSPRDRGFYASVVLRPPAAPARWPAVSVIAGLGLAGGLTASGVRDVRLKWPNDCLVGGRKMAGVLAEAFPDLGFVVLGIGLNLSLSGDDAPPELAETATDIATHLPKGKDILTVCALGFGGMFAAYDKSKPGLEVDQDSAARFLWTRGNVRVGDVSGMVSGIDRSGALVLECRDGSTKKVRAGEVTDAGSD
ncbi:MAG: biotin--[acetyl-CoA-carboxylase] ligase [Deltaproteobacteria bacterium]|nr:biotin--[acetyl-CoA-carboxylase] ligase [Deltaproteobacteria bacterium]